MVIVKKGLLSVLALALVAVVLARGDYSVVRGLDSDDTAKVLDFDTMIGVPRPFTGAANPIRGVNGGGLPWVVDRARGKLRVDGRLDITVEGLVFDPNDPVVIERGLGGLNPVPAFKAIVSCITTDEDGNPAIVNVETELFPADAEGNSVIRDQVELPDPCIAPIVFVTNPGGSWFAASGF